MTPLFPDPKVIMQALTEITEFKRAVLTLNARIENFNATCERIVDALERNTQATDALRDQIANGAAS